MQFLIKLKFGNKYEAFCSSPKLTSIFASDFSDYALPHLSDELDKFCKLDESKSYFNNIAEDIFVHLDYPEVILIDFIT